MSNMTYDDRVRQRAEEFALLELTKIPGHPKWEKKVESFIPAARLSVQWEAEAAIAVVQEYRTHSAGPTLFDLKKYLQSLGLVPQKNKV